MFEKFRSLSCKTVAGVDIQLLTPPVTFSPATDGSLGVLGAVSGA